MRSHLFSIVFCFSLFLGYAEGQSTAFTYQGKLSDGGVSANGQYDLTFRLFDVQAAGTQIGSDIVRDDVNVASGIFSVALDFGASPFTSTTGNYLEISVRLGTSTGPYTALSPRQPITSSPYSIQTIRAQSAAIADNAANLGGTPASQFTQNSDPRLSDARPPTPGSANYIQNSATPQPGSSFNISGDGTVGGTVSGNVVNAATQYNLGGARILGVSATNNTFAGISAGSSTLPLQGLDNSFFGANAGLSNTDGDGNSFFGRTSGRNTTTGQYNSFYGISSGIFNVVGSRNSYFGSFAGLGVSLQSSDFNAFFGSDAGRVSTGDSNAFIGTAAGWSNTTGQGNSFLGSGVYGVSSSPTSATGLRNTTGTDNTFLGFRAGEINTTGSGNSLLGSFAELGVGDLSNASAIGRRAFVTQSNSLVLGSISGINNATANTQVGIGTTAPTFRFHVRADGQDGIKIQHTGTNDYPQIRWTDSNDVFKASIGVGPVGSEGIHLFVNGADRMVIEPSGLIRVPGGIFISNPNTVVVTSANGACWGITVSNAGVVGAFSTACP